MRTLFAVVLALVPCVLFSQDEVQDVEVPRIATFTIETDSVASGMFTLLSASVPTDSATLLQTSTVLNELELVDEQKKKLKSKLAALRNEYQTNQGQLSKTFDGSPKGRERFDQARREYDKNVKAAMEDILLPFQLDRLHQIRLQSELRAGGSRAVESDAFAKLLNLTPEQKKELRDKASDAEQKIAREIHELRQKCHREVLEDVLSKEQLKILDENLGKQMADVSK